VAARDVDARSIGQKNQMANYGVWGALGRQTNPETQHGQAICHFLSIGLYGNFYNVALNAQNCVLNRDSGDVIISDYDSEIDRGVRAKIAVMATAHPTINRLKALCRSSGTEMRGGRTSVAAAVAQISTPDSRDSCTSTP
jgi:hypothetical protein